MNEYMLIYNGGDPDWADNTSPEEMNSAMARWTDWMDSLQQQDRLVTGGSPLHYSGKRLTRDGLVTDIPAAEFKELVSGYSIVKAESIDEAIELAKDCPIFEHGDIKVEVREILQIG